MVTMTKITTRTITCMVALVACAIAIVLVPVNAGTPFLASSRKSGPSTQRLALTLSQQNNNQYNLLSLRGGDDDDLIDIEESDDEEDLDIESSDEYDEEEEEEEEEEKPTKLDPKLAKSAQSSAAKAKAQATATVKAAVNEKLEKVPKTTTKKKSSLLKLFKIPYIVKVLVNPFVIMEMTKGYFSSLFNLKYLEENKDSSADLRSALEAKAKKGGPSSGNRGKRKMKPGQAKTLSDLPQLST